MLLAAVSINGLMYFQGLKALSKTHQSIRGILDMYKKRKSKNTTGTITSIKIFLKIVLCYQELQYMSGHCEY